MSIKDADRLRFDFRFGRRCRAAEEGRHFPSYLELLMGMSFFRGAMQEDVDEFVRQMLLFLDDNEADRPLGDMLDTLRCRPTTNAFKAATEACRSQTSSRGRDYDGWAARLEFYSAALGCSECAVQIAIEAISLSNAQEHRESGCSAKLISQALGWIATLEDHFDTGDERINAVRRAGEALTSRISEGSASAGDNRSADVEDGDFWRALIPSRRTLERPSQSDQHEPTSGGLRVVVLRQVGNQHTPEGKRVAAEWRALISRPLPLTPLPNIGQVRTALLAEFPFAVETIDKLLSELPGRTCVALQPTILVGEPGIGKNHFAEALLRELGVPAWTYPCGGASDSSLAGTSRRWSSGEPSLITSLIRQHACASPGVVLDEIEKVGSSKNGGNLLDALLGMLEPQTARAWMDPYLQAPVDVSHVVWLGTANDVSELPAPLRDRFRILRFPSPGPEHLPVLAGNLLAQSIRDRNHDPRWAMPLTAEELECLSRVWTGGSLRRLKRLVDGVIAVRERDFTLQ